LGRFAFCRSGFDDIGSGLAQALIFGKSQAL
jgi:hypothetical protein